MKKIQIYLFLFLGLVVSTQAQMFEFSAKDAAKIHSRKMIVVLQEEDESILNRIKKDPAKTARYKAVIAYSNSLLKKTVTALWRAHQTFEYKTAKECIALSDSSQDYFTLEFSSLRLNENTQLYYLKPDTSAIYPIRTLLMQRKEYGFFDLKLIEKFKGTAFYSFVTPSSAPNEFDFITVIQFMSAMMKGKLADPKFNTRNYELKIQKDNERLINRTLLADSNIVNKKGKSYDYIKEEYDSLALYELSDPKGISEKAYRKDTLYAYLNVVPYIDPLAHGQSPLGTPGGNINNTSEATVYFMQLIFDVATGDLIYYDKTEEKVIIPRDWRRFSRYSRERVPLFQMPKQNMEQGNPANQKMYQNQYQQNQY